jgi:signal transduction histidine kinase
MVSFASHELRTPLNSIIAMLETMKNNNNKNYLKNAILNAKYLLCMTNDLLDLA